MMIMVMPFSPSVFAFLHLSCFRIRHTHTHILAWIGRSLFFFFLISFNFRVSSDLQFLLIEPI